MTTSWLLLKAHRALAMLTATIVLSLCGQHSATAQDVRAGVWLRLDPLPAEMRMTARESFDGVPPRFVLMTDGSVYVGGRRELLRGMLDKTEMQGISTRLDVAFKSVSKTGVPQTLAVGEGPAIFRFSVLAGSQHQMVVTGAFPAAGAPTLAPLPEFIRRLAGFRHVSLKPFDPAQFAMIVKEKMLVGGCRTPRGLPPLASALTGETVVPETVTRSFPTGAEISQVCDGLKRYAVIFRPLVPGER